MLLVLCNRERGPSFLRAVLSVLHENSDKVADDCKLFHDLDSTEWGRYEYIDPNERPADEKCWYDILTRDSQTTTDLIHFWRQFCLNFPILTGDLQRLSKVTNVEDISLPVRGLL